MKRCVRSPNVALCEGMQPKGGESGLIGGLVRRNVQRPLGEKPIAAKALVPHQLWPCAEKRSRKGPNPASFMALCAEKRLGGLPEIRA